MYLEETDEQSASQSKSKSTTVKNELQDELLSNGIDLTLDNGIAHISLPEPMLLMIFSAFKVLENQFKKSKEKGAQI